MSEHQSFLRIEVRDGIGFVTLDRPDDNNRFNPSERDELHRLPWDMARRDDVRTLVFTGAGDHFSGGADHSHDEFSSWKYYDRSRDFMRAWVEFDKPTIMAVNGPAAGLGLTLALLGDIIIVERHVVLGDAHVLGDIAAATGPWLWPPSTGLGRAKRYLMTGEQLSAEDAEDIGLITETVDTGASMTRATEYAVKFAAMRPEAIQCTKRALNQWMRMSFTPIVEHGLALEFMTFPEGKY